MVLPVQMKLELLRKYRRLYRSSTNKPPIFIGRKHPIHFNYLIPIQNIITMSESDVQQSLSPLEPGGIDLEDESVKVQSSGGAEEQSQQFEDHSESVKVKKRKKKDPKAPRRPLSA
jgi:hypothetical protein